MEKLKLDALWRTFQYHHKKNYKPQLFKNLVIHNLFIMCQTDNKNQDTDLKIKNIHQLSKNL